MHVLSIPCVAMASINFYVGSYYLFFYIKRPQIKEYLPFAFLCLSVGFYDVFSVGLYNSLSLQNGIFWQSLQFNMLIPISVFLIWFTSIFTEQKGNRIIQFSIGWFIIIGIASFLISPKFSLSPLYPSIKNIDLFKVLKITYYEGTVGIIYQIEMISAILVYIYLFYLYFQHYQKTKYKTLFLIFSCQIIYFIGVVNDSLVAMQFYSFIYISEYSFFFTIIAMAYILLDKFVNLHTAFEELNVTLEQKVNQRTYEIEKLNDYLQHLADRDGLTGVYNRRFFDEYFGIEVKRAKNFLENESRLRHDKGNNMNFGLAIIDIDHFKDINDTYGHLAGDNVLKQAIDIMTKNIFTRDVLCRYGGDEFALLLTKTSNDGILQAAEKIRKEIDEHTFVLDKDIKDQHITISVGLVNFYEVLDKRSDEILKLADERLLKAKSNGRNRIVSCNNL